MSRNYHNPLPGVPDVESPFFSELLLGDLGADPEIDRIAVDLNADGFAVFDFPEDDFEAIAGRIVAAFEGGFDWEAWRRTQNLDLRVSDAWSSNDDVRRLAANPRVTAILSRLYGRRAFPFQTLNFPVGTQQHFHTDSVHFSSMPERFMAGVWIALEDIGPDQGPLVYYPGSHKWPVFTNEHIGHSYHRSQTIGDYGRVWERLVEVHDVKPRYFHAKKGQAAIWAANLLHGGSAQKDFRKTRWSQVNHYFFENCAYYTPLFSDPIAGSVYFRKPVDISTGEIAVNYYNNAPLDEQYMDSSAPNNHRMNGDFLPEGFDPDEYLRLNPDVKAAGVDAAEHYRSFGEKEGRLYREA